MSVVITNIYDLELIWRTADDGFLSGVDFKVWLANTVIQLRADLQAAHATIAEQERQLEEARSAFQKIVDLGNSSHAAFDGERWHQMRKVASMALNLFDAHPAQPEPSAEPQP